MTTHGPHSLPSFAQAFSDPSLGSISSGNNSLPPIHTREPPALSRRAKSPPRQSRSRHNSEEDRLAGRKRPRTEITSRDDGPSDSDRDSPHLIRIKEEQDQDMLDPSPPPQHRIILDSTGAPPPSSIQPSASKKRRVTISGAPQLNTNVRAPADPGSSTPISPVVMGFTIMRDNPSAIEQVRSMITVKQKQKALIEQRRGSVASSPSVGTAPPPPLVLPEERAASAKAPASARQRRSPNSGNGTRRTANGNGNGSGPRPLNSLPPPPISFARRRAEQLGGRKKPADIIISPREAQTQEQFQPVIQSAPPIPQGGGQGSFYSGRFPMTLPRLPSVMGGGDTMRRVPGHVPPTPTRLSMQRGTIATTAPASNQPAPGVATRSPPAASVPIASTLVPPTPMSLHHPGMRAEMTGLYRKIDELEDALRLATGRRQSVDSGSLKAKGKQPLRNGNLMASETYTFPPMPLADRLRSEPTRRHPSPGWSQDRDTQSTVESENGSPAPFDARRLSLSATRLDPPRPTLEASSQRSSFNNIHSPPQGFRENVHAHSSPSSHGKMSLNDRPASHRQSSHAQGPTSNSGDRGSTPQHDSRRNSVSMPSPGAPDGS
ncbi:hypothetical protein B0H10DRAFT_2163925 [Mycena sp. CBHHK59/15]|nr:hypothetical protein B0H10DRAFT_2163925 [Mycena sp. CBHHK59/15]